MAELLQVEVVTSDGQVEVRLNGELDVASRSVLERTLMRAARAPETDTVVVDLAGLCFCDASGLHAFEQGRRAAAAHNKRFLLANANPDVSHLFELVQFGETVQNQPSGDTDTR